MNIERATATGSSSHAVRVALERVVASSELAKSPQLVSFLRFVVEAELSGQSRHIKAYTIATDALGRDSQFDPQLDPIVRVEAGRLRRALQNYYESEGRDDPVVIDLPRGSYVPIFRARGQGLGVGKLLASLWSRLRAWGVRKRPWRVIWPSLATGAALYAVLDIFVISPHRMYADALWANRATIGTHPAATGSRTFLPRLRIEPIVTIGKTIPREDASKAIEQFLLDLGAGNDDIITLIDAKPRPRGGIFALAPSYTLTPVATYRSDGTVRLGLTLADDADGELIWSRVIPDFLSLIDAPTESRLATQTISAALYSWFGVIHGRERNKQEQGQASDPHYACLLEAQALMRHFDAERAVIVRDCLEHAVAKDPNFEPGIALLARLYAWIYVFGPDALRETAPSLADATKLAQRAVDLDFDSSKAHIARFDLDFLSGDVAGGIAHGERAYALFPNDAPSTVNFAIQLILAGKIERGLALIRPADTTLTSRSARVYFAEFLAAYIANDAAGAATAAQNMMDEGLTWTHLARALVAVRRGALPQAREHFRKLAAIQSGWRSDPRAELSRFVQAPEIVERIADDLAKIRATASN